MGIELTERAVEQVKRMKAQHALGEGWGLRVAIKAGGCAGYEYLLELEEGPKERDRVFDYDGIKVFCDPKSYLFIGDVKLDFHDSMLGGGFKFENPQAASSCGCGTSFSVG
jgi:iron-sulfur cluster assembly protein